MHRGDSAARPGLRAAADGEQLERVGELGQVAHPVHAVGAGQRFPAAVRPGQGPGMRRDHRAAACRASRSQQNHRDVSLCRPAQHLPQRCAVSDRLEHQADHPGTGVGQRVLEVSRRCGYQFLAGGDSQREAEAAPRPQQGGKHRSRVRDQRYRPGRQRVRLGIAECTQPVADVGKAHAARPAQRHPG